MTNSSLLNLLSWFMLIMILSLIMTNMIHPMSIILMVLLFNIIICLNMSMWKTNFLLSFLFFMIMVSGLLIIFLYFSSLVSNEKAYTKLNMSMPYMLIMMMIIIVYTASNSSMYSPLNSSHSSTTLSTHLSVSSQSTSNQTIQLMFSPPQSNLTLICMIYLLISLISIIKICSTKTKSLRKLQ